jgi:hypothetical protein
LRGERSHKLRAHLVTTWANGRPQRRKEMAWLAADFELHAPNRFLRYTAEGPTPACVDRSNSSFFRIDEENWDAVCRLHGEEQTGTIRRGGIPAARRRRGSGEKVNDIGVNLLQGDEVKVFGA